MFQLGFSTTTNGDWQVCKSQQHWKTHRSETPKVWASCKDVDLAHKLKREVPWRPFGHGVWVNDDFVGGFFGWVKWESLRVVICNNSKWLGR